MISDSVLEQLWKEHQDKIKKDKWKIRNLIKSRFQKLQVSEILFKIFKNILTPSKTDNSMILTTKQLTSNSIKALILENSITAIHVPNFCSPEIAESLSKRALDEYTHWKLGGMISTDMFYAGGSVPIEVANHSWPDFCRYFAERENFVDKQRSMSMNMWPVDRLRLTLDETWAHGACLGQHLGQKLRPAIMRIMDSKHDFNFTVPKHGFIHTDDFPKLKSAQGTYSANIYLRLPEEGGELYIWGINLNRVKGINHYLSGQILSMIMTEKYIFDIKWQEEIIKLLPKPQVIVPKIGDLVIFHSGRPHSVAPVTKGIRVTNQLFIYARGKTAPLTIGS